MSDQPECSPTTTQAVGDDKVGTRLYLVQHGAAVDKHVDPKRPLSEQGRADVEKTAAFLAKAGTRVTHIVHSGKMRARQTAVLLAERVGSGAGAERVSGIGPLDPVEKFARTIDGWTEDTMVVGHLPFMGRLVSYLTVGDAEASAVAFQPGTVTCLTRSKEGRRQVAWMLRPELIPGTAMEKP